MLVLPLLAFVAAHDAKMDTTTTTAAIGSRSSISSVELDDLFHAVDPALPPTMHLERRRTVNGTELLLECPSASHLVRTHMAPDFEHPQLVRRLDWIHEGALIASFHQDANSDISQQWWVSSGRFELRRPFFQLHVAPVLPQDAGQWRCRLETDPLFAVELPPQQQRAGVQLLVLMKPLIPPKPVVQRHTDHSVTLQWDKYTMTAAHMPILRYSVLVAQPEDGGTGGVGGSMRVLSTLDNQTSVEVAGLRPNTRYTFSVRAENTVGESAFGPEQLFCTPGLPPKKSPEIRAIRNGTTADCVDLEWDLPGAEQEHTPIVGFRIMVHRVGTGAMREWYVKGARARTQPLCSLDSYADYVLTLESDNGFGFSTGTTAPFRTDQNIPDGPPHLIQCRPLPGGTSLALTWREPLLPNGQIRTYVIYFKEVPSQHAPGQIRLDVQPGEISKAFAFNLTKLLPNTRYKVRLTAATDKGEGPMSEPLFVDTDFIAPKEPPKITNLSFGCDNALLVLEWTDAVLPTGTEGIYRIVVHSSMATASEGGGQPKIFNISATSPHKLLLDQVQLGEHVAVSVRLLLKSRANASLLLEGPSSELAHFALISNGWRCRFRSSACPSPESLPSTSICEHFPEAAAAQQGTALFGQLTAAAVSGSVADGASNGSFGIGAKLDANMSFVFLVFGIAIMLAISAIFVCMLRRRCTFLKSFLWRKANKKSQQQQKRAGPDKWRRTTTGSGSGPESASLVQKTEKRSVILPPITVPNGRCTSGDAKTMGTSDGNKENSCCELTDPEVRNGPIISVLQFDAYFNEMSANGKTGFRHQFQEIEYETAILLEQEEENEENEANHDNITESDDGNNHNKNCIGDDGKFEKTKDRYVDIGALPRRSRIRLHLHQSNAAPGRHNQHQYINANFVDSCDERRAYIATQAPLPHTFGDFWAMVWQERCQILVALTNMVESGRKKCDQYWPDFVGAKMQAGPFTVTLTAERANSVFIHRVLQLKLHGSEHNDVMGEDGRSLHQLHFMAWPDHGVPDSPFPLLHFVNYVADLHCSITSISTSLPNPNATTISPCVVHCSAGVGRSGAFILIDSLRRHLLRCDRIDVCGQLRRMRQQRVQLVQTLDQFVFCHEVLRHLVANGITRQPRSHFANYCRFLFSSATPSGQQRIQAQFQELLACPHRGGGSQSLPNGGCIPPAANARISLPGYHRTDEFLFCGAISTGDEVDRVQQLWHSIWETKCQSFVILDSRKSNASVLKAIGTDRNSQQQLLSEVLNQLLPVSLEIKITVPQKQKGMSETTATVGAQNTATTSISLQRVGTQNRILLRRRRQCRIADCHNADGSSSTIIDGETATTAKHEELEVHVHRMCSTALFNAPWTEIERLQLDLQQQHRGVCAVLELHDDNTNNNNNNIQPLPCRPTAAPFLFCAFQSAACQLEQEGAVDVLLWLASYRHAVCGCWTDLAEIELVYRKVLELVELQRAIC